MKNDNTTIDNQITNSFLANKALLIDFDGTLVDYKQNESKAIKKLFTDLALSPNLFDQAKKDYSEINNFYWTQFEQKKLNINDVQVRRFEDLFAKYNIKIDSKQINKHYLDLLVSTTEVNSEIISTLKDLKELGIKLVIITNGVHWTQTERLKNSGLMNIIDTYFTSESVGHAKPHPKMFLDSKKYLESINCSTDELWVIGDNFDADIKGAFDVGFNTCWVTQKNGNNAEQNPYPTLKVNSFLEFAQLYLQAKTSS